jgi:CobQ-like glutamine amidotransferase family enzyme
VTTLGPDARRLGQVVAGVGNGGGDGTEGAWTDRVVGTYLHGPVLARNPLLADLLLGWVIDPGADRPLALLDDTEELALRTERLAAVERASRRGRVRRLLARRA